ncbi:MAG: MBL fold metallo-hydrolase [Gammaproteobacteria bacterium]|nr:MBL fold metallo-hydrolase [Gammaproteobacteria bacterium]MDP2347174.1 MBL fold metallo-hydrolase [Gammaproteobacteria bacterium]
MESSRSVLVAGVAVAVGSGRVPVQRVLGRNAGLMTGPGTNSYLIGSQQLALVDPGPVDPGHIDAVLRVLASRSLNWIFVTHTHGDHSPGTVLLQQKTGAEVIGLSPSAGSTHQDHSFTPSRIYHDGEVIDCGEFRVRLVHTPGHVSNHFCFLLEEENILFTGDHILDGTTPVILPPDGNMRHYLESLTKLKTLPLSALAPGHGRMMDDPNGVIDTLIRHRLRREQKTVTGLLELSSVSGPASLEALALRVYDDVPQHLLPWAQRTLLAHLIKLEEDGRVFRTGDKWSGVHAYG